MAKKEYEKLVIETVMLKSEDIFTDSIDENTNGDNFGGAGGDWLSGGGV